MNRIFNIFLLFAAALSVGLTAGGCAIPVGSTGGSIGDDALWVEAKRVTYDEREYFDSSKDLQIFSANRGAVFVVPYQDANIAIYELTPQSVLHGVRVPFDEFEEHKAFLLEPGRKRVEVSYRNAMTEYYIEVTGISVGGEVGQDIVDIIWL